MPVMVVLQAPSYLQPSDNNRITITTCLADHPESRVCVQAAEIAG